MTNNVLEMLSRAVTPRRHALHAGDAIYRTGERFEHLYIINAGFVKIVKTNPGGPDRVVGLNLRGDWLGFDGIAQGRFCCDARAVDTSEVWAMRYEALIGACLGQPILLKALHEAMSRAITLGHDSLLAMCSLPAEARVARFLRDWADSLASRGLRTDRFTLRMTRAEIGSHLGMTLETVSRALSKLARDGVIAFAGTGRRDILVPDVEALSSFVRNARARSPQDEASGIQATPRAHFPGFTNSTSVNSSRASS